MGRQGLEARSDWLNASILNPTSHAHPPTHPTAHRSSGLGDLLTSFSPRGLLPLTTTLALHHHPTDGHLCCHTTCCTQVDRLRSQPDRHQRHRRSCAPVHDPAALSTSASHRTFVTCPLRHRRTQWRQMRRDRAALLALKATERAMRPVRHHAAQPSTHVFAQKVSPRHQGCGSIANPTLATSTIQVPSLGNVHAMAWYLQPCCVDADYYLLDSWVEVSSQPSSSSLSSIGEEIITTGLRVQNHPRPRRRRTSRDEQSSHQQAWRRARSAAGTSSQEEYEESESESDRIMTSSNEAPVVTNSTAPQPHATPNLHTAASDDDDENKTAINYPIRNEECFTPQPNAFSHPPSGQLRSASQPTSGSYFPPQRRDSRSSVRPYLSSQTDGRRESHWPQNILSPSFDVAAQNEEALRTSLSTLLSCAAAARGLGKTEDKRQTAGAATLQRQRSTRIEPTSFRLIPESALPSNSPPQLQEPTFHPTLRRQSTSTTTSSEEQKENKRKVSSGRSSSRERRALKRARRTHSSEDLAVSPTLLTWVVSAGVVVFLSALSFSAGYSLGRESGRLEASSFATDEQLRSCAREAGRSGLGLKRSLARSAVQV